MDVNDLILEPEVIQRSIQSALQAGELLDVQLDKKPEHFTAYFQALPEEGGPGGFMDISPLIPLTGNRNLPATGNVHLRFVSQEFLMGCMVSFTGIVEGKDRRLVRLAYPSLLRVLSKRAKTRFVMPPEGDQALVGVRSGGKLIAKGTLKDISKEGLAFQTAPLRPPLGRQDKVTVEVHPPRGAKQEAFSGISLVCFRKAMHAHQESNKIVEVYGVSFAPMSQGQNMILGNWMNYVRRREAEGRRG